MSKKIRKLGILGAGSMGKLLACLLADKGLEVLVWNRSYPAKVLKEVGRFLSYKVSKGEMSTSKKRTILSRIIPIENFSLLRTADAVIETVVEDFSIKSKLLNRLCKLDTFEFIATNTSCFSITKLSKHCLSSKEIIGLHFFNPPTKLDLVEIIVGEHTSKRTISKCKAFCCTIKKSFIVIPDEVGSIVNRILCAALNEGARVYGESKGKLTFSDIDEAMVKGAAYPIGPFALADLIGTDVCLSMLKILSKRFNSKVFMPVKLWRDLVYKKRLGRKTTKGFYKY